MVFAITHIRSLLAKKKKKLVLFIDNFGDLLDRLPENDIRAMRAVMMAAPDLRMVAGSARVLEHTYAYDKPFFDFFNLVYLKELDAVQALEMMRALAACSANPEEMLALIEARKARIEGIRRLTGGVPRNLMLLFGMIAEDPEQGFLPALEQILDGATPYFKHRVEELAKQQQQILHHIAMSWDAAGAGEIAEKMHEDSKKVSAQLRQMLDNDLLERVETGTKNHLYRLKERFFNIWYLMRMAGQRDLARMRWLVEFLKGWLEGPELQDRMALVRDALEADGQTMDAFYLDKEIAKMLTKQHELAFQLVLEPEEDELDSHPIVMHDPGAKYYRASDRDYDPDLVPYNILIRDAQSWNAAKKAFQQIDANGLAPNIISFNTLLAKTLGWKDAGWAWKELKASTIQPDIISFTTLLSKTPSWEDAEWIWKESKESGLQPDIIFFSTLLHKAPTWKDARWVWEELKTCGILPNIVSFNTLLNKAPTWGDVGQVWDELETSGIQPNIVSFNTLLNKTPSWKDAGLVREELKISRILPDIIFFSILLNKAPTWEDAVWTWEELKISGIQPNIISFGTLLNKKTLTLEKALELLDQLNDIGIKSNANIFQILWGKCDTYSQCLEILASAQISGFFNDLKKVYEKREILNIQRACWHLWHNGLCEYHTDAINFFFDQRPKKAAATWQEFYLLLLLIKRQRQACLALFEENPYQLKEVFKPIYYALLKIWGPEKSQELLRMPPEIESTVDEVVAFVKDMQEKYRT